MKRKIFSTLFALVLVLSFSLIPATPVSAQVPEVWVDDDAPSSWYDTTHLATIQGGVNAVDIGGTVHVLAGTYVEILVVNKANLMVESVVVGQAVIDVSGGTDAGVVIAANGVTLDGFEVVGADWFNVGPETRFGIYLGNVSGVTISNNIVKDISVVSWAGAGIVIQYGDRNNIINNLVTSNQGDGIVLYNYASYNTIEGNTCTGNGFNGIILNLGCHDNIVKGNTSTNNGMGITIARDSNYNSVVRNTASGNIIAGVYLQDGASYNVVNRNFLTVNGSGVLIFDEGTGDPEDNQIHANNIYWNTGTTWQPPGFAPESIVAGIHVSTTVAAPVNARSNWWGDASGPYHVVTNPTGAGDEVTDKVIYKPWRKKALP